MFVCYLHVYRSSQYITDWWQRCCHARSRLDISPFGSLGKHLDGDSHSPKTITIIWYVMIYIEICQAETCPYFINIPTYYPNFMWEDVRWRVICERPQHWSRDLHDHLPNTCIASLHFDFQLQSIGIVILMLQ